MRKLGVMFRDLRVAGLDVGGSVSHVLASVFHPQSLIKYINTLWHPPVRDIISGFEGLCCHSKGDASYVYLIHRFHPAGGLHENLP